MKFFILFFLIFSLSCSSKLKTETPVSSPQSDVFASSSSAFSLILGLQNVRTPSAAPMSCESVLNVALAEGSLFKDCTPLSFFLSGEFDRIHKANEGGNWTGDEREDPQYWTEGVLRIDGETREYAVRMRARGMSSAAEGELEFPKLRVEINKSEDLKGTLFRGNRKFRMNTHGKDVNPPGELSRMGRLLDERSPYREGFIYELGQAMEIPSPLVRRARVTYLDKATHRRTTRNALIIETDGNLEDRLGWKRSYDFLDSEYKGRMSVDLAARFHLFNILVGNDDIGLKIKNEPTVQTELYRPLFNTTIFADSQGNMYPILYDFDLALLVGGWNQRPHLLEQANTTFDIGEGKLWYYFDRLAFLRTRLSRAEYEAALAYYREKAKPQFEQIIQAAIVDDEAKQMFRELMRYFEQAATHLARYPMLMKKDVGFFKDSEMKESLLLEDKVDTDEQGNPTFRKLRAGTPVIVLERGQGWVKIAIWDLRGDLQDAKQNIGYIRTEDLVLGQDLPENLQGPFNNNDFAF